MIIIISIILIIMIMIIVMMKRYFETRKRVNYIGDCSAGGTSDFRYYNYRRVPYFGGSDNYQYMKQKPTGWGGARRL